MVRPKKTTLPPLDPAIAQRIAGGAMDDPFAALGPHEDGGVERVTAFDPGAEAMWAVQDEVAHPLPPAGAPGVFSGPVPARAPYFLRGEGGGQRWDYDDPYRFGPVLGEIDEYLIGEGTHERLWHVLGAHVIDHEGSRGTHFAVWAPNARCVGGGGRIQRLGRAPAPDAQARRDRGVGDLPARRGRGRALQVPHHRTGRRCSR
jgi:1,4-alpha-glucan branching enzyme